MIMGNEQLRIITNKGADHQAEQNRKLKHHTNYDHVKAGREGSKVWDKRCRRPTVKL